MQLRLSELDSGLARRILDSDRASRIALPEAPPLRRRGEGEVRPKVTPKRVALGVLLVPLFWFLSLCVGALLMGVTGSEDFGAAVMLLLAGLSPFLAINWVVNGWSLPRGGVARVPAAAAAGSRDVEGRTAAGTRVLLSRPILEAVFDAVIPVGPQATYARSVVALMELVEKGRMEERQARDVLAQLNALMASDRELAAQDEGIEAAMHSGEGTRLGQERTEIERRLAAARDDVARQALERSREMLESRQANHDSLALLHERVLAQREAVEQTLGSLESALTRLKLSGGEGAASDALGLARLQETVAAFNRESRAVEQAVQEVARL